MSGLTIRFFHAGVADVEIGKWKYENYPCSVTLHGTPPPLNEAEALITATQNDSLSDRVKPVPSDPNQNIVDQFFLIQHQTTTSRVDVVRVWSDLTSYTQKIAVGSGVAGLILTFVAVYGAPIYIEVVLLAGIVAACCLFGWSLQRHSIAENELNLWIHPGEDFALRRKADLELPLDKICEKKCHFNPEKPGGTLLGIEIFYLFKKSLQQFAEPLLARKCDKPDQQHQWVFNFFTSNPLMIEFFKDNPHLEKEEEWKIVQPFHLFAIELRKGLETLQEQYFNQFPKDLEAVRKKLETLKTDIDQTVSIVFTTLALDAPTKESYQKNLVWAFNEEFFSKISVLALQHRTESSHFCSFAYPQVRKLLELASTQLVNNEPCVVEPSAFSLDKKPSFSMGYLTIVTPYPKNVIDRAKSLDASTPYQKFMDEVFNSLKPFDKLL